MHSSEILIRSEASVFAKNVHSVNISPHITWQPLSYLCERISADRNEVKCTREASGKVFTSVSQS
jgi:hypothetical protein